MFTASMVIRRFTRTFRLVLSPGLACGHHLAAVTCCQMLHIYIGTNTHSGWQPPSISLWICLRPGPRAPSSYAQVSKVLTSVPGKLKPDSAWRTTNQLNTFRHRVRAGCLLSRCCAAMLPAPTHGGAMMTRLPSPTPPCHRRHTDGLRRTQKLRADLLTVIPRYLLLRHVGDSSSGRATWRCGGRRVELENLSGAHGGNDKPAPVQSPKRGAARQASKRANQYLSCVYRDNLSIFRGLPRSG